MFWGEILLTKNRKVRIFQGEDLIAERDDVEYIIEKYTDFTLYNDETQMEETYMKGSYYSFEIV